MSVSRLEPCDYASNISVTASLVISNRRCAIQGLLLHPAAASCTVTLYDPPPFAEGATPTTTGATEIVRLVGVAAGSSVALPQSASGILARNGCIAVVSGTGAFASVIFAKF